MIESNTMVGAGTGMKVVVSREELTQKLGVVARAVSTRASVQILSGVLLRGEGGRLQLAATDMELSLRSSLEAQVEGDGAVVVPGRLLVDLVRLLPAEEVSFEHRPEEGVVHVTSGSSHSSISAARPRSESCSRCQPASAATSTASAATGSSGPAAKPRSSHSSRKG